ncbi:MAG TPA: 4-(cytidine 5'-diphospho)-2-C-methyl-D-erythritol kinase [Syntrophomonadaceae bacterium]|nr:4-(cytidine 5'-diphospho)-2-C-methyl-D-erythritol kinase [Syntrophomonadaceae bacterium]
MVRSIIIEAPAKVNLTLDVKGKRADGYHELETLMHQINLVDRVYIEEAKSLIVQSNSTLIPEDEGNLAYRAAWAIMDKYGNQEGVRIFIEKNIPVGAGLAGGSTDAAAVLIGINRLFDLGVNPVDLMNLGAVLGSDVPFCMQGRTAMATGRGEILTPLPAGPSLNMVLVKPAFQLSTAQVYADLNCEQLTRRPDNRAFVQAWLHGDYQGIAVNMINVLESVSVVRHPEIGEIKEGLKKMGALQSIMSGSGPSVIGVFEDGQKAQEAVQKMKERYQEVYLVSSYMGE